MRLPHPQLGMERELSEKSILVLVQSYDEDEEGLRDFVSSASWCNRRFAPGKESQKIELHSLTGTYSLKLC